MKKIICFLMFVALTTSTVFGQDSANFKNGISLGGFGTISPVVQGGGFDFGFGLLQKGTFYMRNHIEISSMALAVDAGAFAFREKLILGNHLDVTDKFAIRTYGIIEIGFLMFGVGDGDDDYSKKFEDAPFILEPRGGFGTEFMFAGVGNTVGSMFIEMMGGAQVLTTGESLSEAYTGLEDSYVSFNIGGRFYF